MPTPFGECRIGTWSGTRNLDDDDARLKVTCLAQWRIPLGEYFRGNISGRAGFADASHGPADSDAHGAGNMASRVRESYIEYERGFLRIRAGRQNIAWGRSDRFNPTDNLSPRDFTFLSQEDDEQRNGIAALSIDAKVNGEWSLSGIYVPRFTPHVMPNGLLPSTIIFEHRPAKHEVALKLDRAGKDVDWSLSFYRGFDRFARFRAMSPFSPPFAPPFAPLVIPTISARFDPQQTLGADIAFNAGKFAFRAEAAASRYSSPNEPSRTVNRAVAGVDRGFFETGNINVQLFSIHRANYVRATAQPIDIQRLIDGLDRLNSEFGRFETGATLRVSNRFLNDRLRVELGAIYDFSGHGSILRPRLAYSFSDAIRLSAGADYFHGADQSYFGARVKNNLAYLEFAWIF
ncbi:MAG: hypothetical protein IPP88_17735 [Betaproteobacteria bacterium]|nr:hypothetical protein [Betaproteobacteria bacterium]